MKHQPVSALDVAAYILQQTGEITSMKLQKLVYYCQAWGLVWDEAPLFTENIMHVLWYDPLHKICPAPKKHT